jgi:DNA-binding SARP family transcriptional activator/Tfp pilus assembly protein PilF
MSQMMLYLLGAPRIECNGSLVHVDTRKAIALLAFLTLSERHQSRDTLAALLWPEGDHASARAALRRTLSTLNTALAGVGLVIERETIGLEPNGHLWIDALEFERALASARLDEAVILYGGDFLQGFTLRDSAEFDDWQFHQTERLRRGLASALETLVERSASMGNYDRAIAHTRRWLALDPLHEAAHGWLMRLYGLSGQRSAAIRQYRECVRILDQELGVAPLEETTQIFQSILDNRLATNLTLEPHLNEPAYSQPFRLPLVGRDREFNELSRLWSLDGHLIVLEGEAGIGKTRLAETFLEAKRREGIFTLAATCYEGETHLAFAPFVALLRAALDTPGWVDVVPVQWRSEIARLLPEIGHEHQPSLTLEGPGAQSRFFEAINVALTGIWHDKPRIVLIDNVHWADSASLDLITYLIRRLPDGPVCFIMTWRTEDVPRGHVLRTLYAERAQRGKATLIPLQRFTRSQVLDLVQSSQVQSIPSAKMFIERLYQETEGLPFFLAEYLALMAEGALSDDEWTLPANVHDLLRSRLSALSEVGKQVLNTAAVIERSFDLETLREASGRTEDEVVDALDELTRRGLIRAIDMSGTIPRFEFYHEKLHTLVYTDTSPARRRLLHKRVAGALSNRGRRGTENTALASQIAYHYELAGQESEAANYHFAAGKYARSLNANREALVHFQAALALGYAGVADVHEALGNTYTLLGNYADAIRSYEAAAALCEPDHLAFVEHRIGRVLHRSGDWELADKYFETALDNLPSGQDGLEAVILADWSLVAYQRGSITQGQALAQRSLDIARDANYSEALAQAYNILGILARHIGDSALAKIHVETSLDLAKQFPDPSAQIAALNNLALVYQDVGRIEEAVDILSKALLLCQQQGDRHREAALHNNLADLFHAAGRELAAMDHLKQAVSLFADVGRSWDSQRPEIWKLTEW